MEANKQQPQETADFKGVKERLHQIAEAVDDPELSLDEALDLYEEAVALGLQASDLLEVGITEEEVQAAASEGGLETPGADDGNDGATSEGVGVSGEAALPDGQSEESAE